jgi:hypothetical protein
MSDGPGRTKLRIRAPSRTAKPKLRPKGELSPGRRRPQGLPRGYEERQTGGDHPRASVEQPSWTAAVNVGLRALISGLGPAVGRSRRDGGS